MSRASSIAWLLMLSLELMGCAASLPAASAPATSPRDESPAPATANAPGEAGKSPPTPPPAAPPGDASASDRASVRAVARADFDRAQRDLEIAAADCGSACRALASMERATTHLCSLADAPDDQRRCDDARARLLSARGRVLAACGACP